MVAAVMAATDQEAWKGVATHTLAGVTPWPGTEADPCMTADKPDTPRADPLVDVKWAGLDPCAVLIPILGKPYINTWPKNGKLLDCFLPSKMAVSGFFVARVIYCSSNRGCHSKLPRSSGPFGIDH